MGTVLSNVATRRLPKEKPSSWAGSRLTAAERARPRPEKPSASEHKNEGERYGKVDDSRTRPAIETDDKDPHFMEKLSRLGQVRVGHPMQTVRAASDVQNMHRSRIRSEAEASRPPESTKNCLVASSLAELLEARKSIRSGAELEALAKRYHLDAVKLHQLGRVVNTPSIDESTVSRVTDKHGEESLTTMAQWIDPALSRT